MPEIDELFNDYRPLLFSVAYRMLGSVMDAEDYATVLDIADRRIQAICGVANPEKLRGLGHAWSVISGQ